MAQGETTRDTTGELSPLPDFCSAETLLRVLMVAVLLALAVALLRGGGQDWLCRPWRCTRCSSSGWR